MMGKDKCSQCMNSFTMLKLPRKLPSCEHSICEPCLRQIIDSRQDMIICGFCSALVRKEEIRLFSLNTSVLLQISQKPIIVQTQQPVLNEEENQLMTDLLITSPRQVDQVEEELCPKHKVILDIVCISDKQRICPHCALFGPHRDHRFKRLDDFERELKEKRQVFKEIQADKQRVFSCEIDQLGSQFSKKKEMRRSELRSKIEEEFRRYEIELRKRKEQAIHQLQTAFADLEERFKTEGPAGKFQNVRKKLSQWQQSCLQSLHKLDTTKRVEDRLYFYYQGPLEIVTQGYIYIEELNKYKEQAFRKMTDSIGEVKVSFEGGTNFFDKCARVSTRSKILTTSQLKEIVQDECQVNPFLDCTSSQIIIGTNSFLNNNTSLEVDIASIPSSNKKISFDSTKKISSPVITPTKNEAKHNRSVEKERTRMQAVTPQVKKAISPKVSTGNISKRPMSELGTFKSPSKVLKNTLTKQLPSKSKECSFIERDNSTLESKEPQKIYLQFSKNTLCDFFDISECNLSSDKVVDYVHRARRIHKIRGLKICNNRLNTQGFQRMTEFLQGVSNINAANNQLTEGIFQVIVRNKERLDSLRVLNLAHNPLNLQKDKKASAKLEEVKKMGVIVTL